VEELLRTGLIRETEIMGLRVHRMSHAYPVLEIGFKQALHRVTTGLRLFRNLHLAGRSGLFSYTWIHDHMRHGREIVAG
jgi:protoporphyrinogen oxidase